MGSESRRKEHYARLMTAAPDLTRMPPALNAVLEFAATAPVVAKNQDPHPERLRPSLIGHIDSKQR
jgi:hypothetical protein